MGEQEQAVSGMGGSMPSRLVAILGMHRSGTSCLTGSLQSAGLSLGDCHTWNKHNQKGNRENQKFVDLHDAILEANGGAWNEPPINVTWKDEHVTWAKELLLAHAGESNFGFKDPRALLVIDGWKALYPKIEFIGIYRHPIAVVKSLKRRNNTHENWIELWYAYNSILYQQYKKNPFPILCFDDDEAALDDKIVRAAGQMGLVRQNNDQKFYTSELRHNDASGEEELPEHIAQLYRNLKNVEF